MKYLTALMLTFFAGFVSIAAQAQDRCADIIVNGTVQTSNFAQSDYFQQIIWSRFLKSTYQSSKTDRSGGLNVPVGEIVLGTTYSEAQYNAKKAQIQSEYFNQITAARQIDVALASGDPVIVGAWSDCMARSGGGTTVRFEPLSDTQVFVILEYRLQGRTTRDRLIADVPLPEGVTASDPARCLRRGTYIEVGRECRAMLTLASATTTVALTVPGRESVAQAWLPARIKLVREAKPFVFAEGDLLYRHGHKVVIPLSASVTLSTEDIKAGWLFDPATVQAKVQKIYLNKADCDRATSDATIYTFSYGYRLYAPNRTRGGKDGAATCKMAPFIMMKRDIWTAGSTAPQVQPAPL